MVSCSLTLICLMFFFQAEDGIRDYKVTGVQTCALPISEAARGAGEQRRFGLDWFGFVVSFKGVFLEGVEVVFIVITFGLNAGNVPVAAASAVVAGLVVTTVGVIASRPLSAVPENTLKYAVGLLLATYGTFWAVEGLGALHGGRSLEWPGGDVALLVVLGGWLLLSRILVSVLRRQPV